MIELLGNSKVTLRAPEPQDVDRLYLWENDTRLWPYGSTRAPLSHHQLWSYVDGYDGDISATHQLRMMIVAKDSGETIGAVDLYDYDARDGRAKVGVFIDEPHRHKGYGQESLKVVADYARQTLGLHQIAALVCTDNLPSIGLFKNAGFKSKACLRSWVRRGRHYSDVLVFQLML